MQVSKNILFLISNEPGSSKSSKLIQALPNVGFSSSTAPFPLAGAAFLAAALGSVISSSGGGSLLNFIQHPFSLFTCSSNSTSS